MSEVYEIALQGMKLQKAYLEAASKNIANANQISSSPNDVAKPFMASLNSRNEVEVIEQDIAMKAIYKPEHAKSDAQGFIYTPDINMVEQMLMLNKANRHYEANIKAFNAYKEMGAKAIEIGK
ncbi:hypothetical protein HR060_11005 [Catenovulum sp. SM1970]|uniref:flagellar basal body rod protein FlgC n=1 Tax=Marinifaba aquimaris TaxID=2741323 RepID=UPI0015747FEC|nr:flagellar basal body rod C-terminal domain-containing protein [Marinifaba aquimaris]NTS77388.1 hypothetical protein [Marinifaba aquimaris]